MNKNNKIIGICLIVSLILLSPIISKADSGWDSSYDVGGGGWSSSGGYDSWSSTGHSSSSGSGVFGPIFSIATSILLALIIIVEQSKKSKNYKGVPPIENPALESLKRNNKPFIINKHSKTKKGDYNVLGSDIEQSKIDKIDPSIKIEKFKKKAFIIYKDIQEAWMNFDTDTIRNLTTDEIYNMYSSQLKALKLKHQKNVMKNIEYVDAKITNITKDAGIISVVVYLRVKCLDYVIDVKTNKTLRGKDNTRLDIQYLLTFVKEEINKPNIETCPNCGAPVKLVGSTTCPYCDSILVRNPNKYVLSKKICIGQRLDK